MPIKNLLAATREPVHCALIRSNRGVASLTGHAVCITNLIKFMLNIISDVYKPKISHFILIAKQSEKRLSYRTLLSYIQINFHFTTVLRIWSAHWTCFIALSADTELMKRHFTLTITINIIKRHPRHSLSVFSIERHSVYRFEGLTFTTVYNLSYDSCKWPRLAISIWALLCSLTKCGQFLLVPQQHLEL